MKVTAIKAGYHRHLRKVNDTFDMDESKFKRGKDGKPVPPSWVVPVAEKPAAKPGKQEKNDLV